MSIWAQEVDSRLPCGVESGRIEQLDRVLARQERRTMSVQEFQEHVRDAAPAFRCYACGDHLEKLNLTASISNDLNPPASLRPS